MLIYLTQGISLGFVAGVSPGPLQAYFLNQALKNGWKRTLPAAFAPLISDGPIILVVLGALTQTPDWLLRGLRLAGGGFLLYLAWRVYRTFRQPPALHELASGKTHSLREATLMNLLNPNPYIFWSAVLGPSLLAGWRESPAYGISLVAGFYGALVLVFMGVIVMFSSARHLGPKLTKALNGLSALALLVFGVYQIGQGIG